MKVLLKLICFENSAVLFIAMENMDCDRPIIVIVPHLDIANPGSILLVKRLRDNEPLPILLCYLPISAVKIEIAAGL